MRELQRATPGDVTKMSGEMVEQASAREYADWDA
jgi:hypothetical protein